MHQTDTNSILSGNSRAAETYIGHPYSPAMYQPAALHEEGAERSQRVASPSCTLSSSRPLPIASHLALPGEWHGLINT